jgi:hypothetical protein
MPTHPLADGIIALRPFVPGRDFELSKQFYSDLGFQVVPLGDKLAAVSIGTFGFLLQDYFVQVWADNFMMHMLVDNLGQWWDSIAALDLVGRYGVRAPRPPRLEPWGLRVAYVFDPSGVLWHFAEEAEPAAPGS